MERPHVERRLTAVLLADVVGYSRLMSVDEEGTHLRFGHLVEEVIEPKTADYGGRLIRSMGDGLLVEFDSAFAAVRCALEIQKGLAEKNAGLRPDRRIELRIGVNAGDVIREQGDIYGHSVNIAARLEQLAEPGAVCVGSAVYDQLRGSEGLAFLDRGRRLVKNIDHPIHVFRVAEAQEKRSGFPQRLARLFARLTQPIAFRRLRPVHVLVVLVGLVIAGTLGLSAFPVLRDAWNPWRHPSILVLPFKNASNDREQDYLADAVTVDLSTDLSHMRGLLVIAPATALTFKGKDVDPRGIYREIGARYLVEGAIRRVGSRVETDSQLIDGASGVQIWADRFGSEFGHLLRLEHEITGRIAQSLDVALVKAEARRVAPGSSPSALDLRLRAESIFFGSITPAHTLAARRLLGEAVRLDPNSAESWARLAEITASDYLVHWNGAGPAQREEAEEAAQKALALDPDLALAHLANGFVERALGNHQAALEAFSRAIALNANLALAYVEKADELILLGRPNEAPALVAHAIKLSPRDPSLGIFYWVSGRAYFYAGHYGRAVPWLARSVEMRPNLWFNRLYMASAEALLGKKEEAGKTLASFNRLFSRPLYTVAHVEALEHPSPSDNAVVAAAHGHFYEGLLRAGMKAR